MINSELVNGKQSIGQRYDYDFKGSVFQVPIWNKKMFNTYMSVVVVLITLQDIHDW